MKLFLPNFLSPISFVVVQNFQCPHKCNRALLSVEFRSLVKEPLQEICSRIQQRNSAESRLIFLQKRHGMYCAEGEEFIDA